MSLVLGASSSSTPQAASMLQIADDSTALDTEYREAPLGAILTITNDPSPDERLLQFASQHLTGFELESRSDLKAVVMRQIWAHIRELPGYDAYAAWTKIERRWVRYVAPYWTVKPNREYAR